MRHRRCYIAAQSGNTHLMRYDHLLSLQQAVSDVGGAKYPIFMRLGGSVDARFQPVTARALLAEVESFTRQLQHLLIPGARFFDDRGDDLGAVFLRTDESRIGVGDEMQAEVSPRGIRVRLRTMPPPVGFRSATSLPPGEFECYFDQLTLGPDLTLGRRTEEMGGSGAAVTMPSLRTLPATRWDYARVAGKPSVARVEYEERPAPEVFRDLLHAFESACDDSLRLRSLLQFRLDG